MQTRLLFAVAVAAVAIAGPAQGAQRTFVASFGNDANTAQLCRFSAPCRTFSAAVAQTDPLGEVIVLDSAGYGAVTIAKSVSIIAAPGIYAGVSVFINEGISVNLAGIRVVLRGLTVNGQGGDYGIRLVNADELHIENCVVSNVNSSGILIGGSGARVYIKDTVVRDNSGDGVEIAGGAFVSADHVRIEDNGFSGVDVNGPAQFSVANSVISGNGQEGVLLARLDRQRQGVDRAFASFRERRRRVERDREPDGADDRRHGRGQHRERRRFRHLPAVVERRRDQRRRRQQYRQS